MKIEIAAFLSRFVASIAIGVSVVSALSDDAFAVPQVGLDCTQNCDADPSLCLQTANTNYCKVLGASTLCVCRGMSPSRHCVCEGDT
jgi:hypothetical protein